MSKSILRKSSINYQLKHDGLVRLLWDNKCILHHNQSWPSWWLIEKAGSSWGGIHNPRYITIKARNITFLCRNFDAKGKNQIRQEPQHLSLFSIFWKPHIRNKMLSVKFIQLHELCTPSLACTFCISCITEGVWFGSGCGLATCAWIYSSGKGFLQQMWTQIKVLLYQNAFTWPDITTSDSSGFEWYQFQ